MGKTIVLRHPRYAGLSYGPNNEIQFGNKAGLPDHFAHVDEDHPLLPALLDKYPEIIPGDELAKPAVIFICADHPDREFRSKSALAQHLRTKAHRPDDDDADDADDGDDAGG